MKKTTTILITFFVIFEVVLYFVFNSFLDSNATEAFNSWYNANKNTTNTQKLIESLTVEQNRLYNSKYLRGISLSKNKSTIINIGKIDLSTIDIKEGITTRPLLKKFITKQVKINKESYLVTFFIHSMMAIYLFIICSSIITISFLVCAYLLIKSEKDLFKTRLSLKQTQIDHNNKINDLYKMLAHDIRSPLAALKIVSEPKILETEKGKELFKISTDRISEIAKDLLSKNILDKSNENTIINLHLLIQSIIDEKQVELPKLDLHYNVDESSQLLNTRLIPSEFKRSMSNLINNANESNNSPKVEIELKSQENNLVITIKDNGPGISEDKIRELFTEKKLSTTKSTGNGLGLKQVMAFVNSAGGNITLSSNQGLEVVITLKTSN